MGHESLTTGPCSGRGFAFSLWKLKLAPEALATLSRILSSSRSISDRALTVTCAPYDRDQSSHSSVERTHSEKVSHITCVASTHTLVCSRNSLSLLQRHMYTCSKRVCINP